MPTAEENITTITPAVKTAVVQHIPLNKLSLWKGNVRKTGAKEGLDELRASIAALGLLNPLTVRPAPKGKYEIIAGQRRFLALSRLAKEGAIPTDHPVPCTIVSDDADATEISLAENVARTSMHPADQFEAFRDLIDKGSSAADVAARFGVSEGTVIKRMKLGRVSPKLLTEYRAGKMSLEQVQAFALSDDHAQQEKVWAAAEGWQKQPQHIRQALTKDEVAATDRRVQFIGLDAYEAAGGKVRRDLFDDANAGYIIDAALLNDLVTKKLWGIAAPIRAEGWKWVEARPTSWTYEETRHLQRIQPQTAPLSPEDAAEQSALAEEYDALCEAANGDEGNLTDEQATRLQQITDRLGELEQRESVFSDERKAIAGVLIGLDWNGKLDIERGYVRPEDHTAPKVTRAKTGADATEPEQDGISAALMESLTAERTAALRLELALRPGIALAAVVHRLAVDHFGIGRRVSGSCIAITAQPQHLGSSLDKPDENAASIELDRLSAVWSAKLPNDPEALFHWCLAATQAQLMELLALCVGSNVSAVVSKKMYGADPAKVAHADALATALDLDMAKWFTPTAENYFGRISKPQIVEAMTEMNGGPLAYPTAPLKKSALASSAQRAAELRAELGDPWVPEMLRTKAAMAASEAPLDAAA